jgi:hypothetical protein
MATYSTSADCALAAGIKTTNEYTYPTTAMIDNWRAIACSKIHYVIGNVVDNANFDARSIEMSMVSRMIQSIQNRNIGFSIELTEEERTQLANIFEAIPGSKWEPDQNGMISGSPSTTSGLPFSPWGA